MIVAVLGAQNGIGAIEAYKTSWKFLWKYFWLGILWTILIFAGFLIFVIPGIYLLVSLGFAFIILIAEKDSNGKVSIRMSLKKSHHYVKGYWWQTLGRFLFLLLVLLGFVMILGVVVLFPAAFAAMLNPQFSSFVQSVGGTIINVVLTPFSTIYWYLLYEDLKKVKQSQELI